MSVLAAGRLSEHGEGAVIGTPAEVPVEHFLEYRIGIGRGAEQRHGGLQLEVVGAAQDFNGRFSLDMEQGLRNFYKMLPQYRMGEVVFGFLQVFDPIEGCHVAFSQAFELGKDIPHPVGGLFSGPYFRKGFQVVLVLGFQEAGESFDGVHWSICFNG